jgi:8-oxo-dGTP diphosphatase
MSPPSSSDPPAYSPEFYASLPGLQVGAGCIFLDRSDRVLLVKPAYKDPWEIPGGAIEADESPLAACTREIREELGIEWRPGRLLCIDYRRPVDGLRGGALRIVFFGGVLSDEDTFRFVLNPEELLEWKFVDPAELDSYVTSVMARRIRASISSTGLSYLEEGSDPGVADS